MNPAYHFVLGITISKLATGQILPEIIIVSVLPDLLGTPLMVIDKVADSIRHPEGNFLKKFKKDLFTTTFLKNADRITYRTTHSLLINTIFGILAYIFFPEKYLLLTFCYFLHLLIDVPTHSKDWATRLLYPFSDAHFDGYNWWENKMVSLMFWLPLAVITFFAFY